MGQPSEDFSNWVKKCVNDITDEGTISKFVISHALEHESTMELLGTVRVKQGDEHLDISQELWDLADEDARARLVGRMQRYVVLAYRADEEDQHDARHAFLLNGKASMDVMAGDTESATPTGLQAQQMRHTEKLHGLLMQVTEVSNGRLMRDLEQERAARARLELRYQENLEAREELMTRKHERDMEIKKEEARQERFDQMMGLVMGMLPLAAAKLLGPAALAAGQPFAQLPAAGARDASVHQLLKNLSPTEIEGVLNSLRPENQMVIMELYQAHKAMEEESEKAKKLPSAEESEQEPVH